MLVGILLFPTADFYLHVSHVYSRQQLSLMLLIPLLDTLLLHIGTYPYT